MVSQISSAWATACSGERAAYLEKYEAGSRNAVSPQGKGKQQYTFQSWSDGGAQTHNIVAPANPVTYTARFK